MGGRPCDAGQFGSRRRRSCQRARDIITLDIEDAARVEVIGANRAGNTTLLRVLARIYSPSRGMLYSWVTRAGSSAREAGRAECASSIVPLKSSNRYRRR